MLRVLLLLAIAYQVLAVPVEDGPGTTTDAVAKFYAAAPREHARLPFGAGIRKDDVGVFPYDANPKTPRTFVETVVDEILDDGALVVRVKIFGWERSVAGGIVGTAKPVERRSLALVVDGVDTSDVADGDKILLPGGFRVEGTRKVNGRTLRVLRAFRLPVLAK